MPAFVTVRWLGHATFEIASAKGTRFVVDPFITGNPATPAAFKSLDRYAGPDKPAAVLLTHSHGDHAADAVAIAKLSGAPVIGEYELVNSLGLPETQVMGGNVGGKLTVNEVAIHFVPAVHSSTPGGRPLGFVFDFGGGNTLYETGDTWIFGDMALIQELFQPRVILMNMGGGPYTQDPRTAALAVKKYFSPAAIVPFHWGTFPILASEADIRTAFPNDDRLAILTPGEARSF